MPVKSFKKDRSNVLTRTFKTEVTFTENDSYILDDQSRKLNWAYNQMLECTINDYKYNDNKLKLYSGYNGRNYFKKNIKPKNNFLNTLYSMVLDASVMRVKKSFKQFFERGCVGYPKYKSWKEKWFSLEYEAPNTQGIKIDGKNITFSLGKDVNKKQMYVTGILSKNIKYKNYKLNTVTLTKERHKSGDKFFVSFSCDIPKKKNIDSVNSSNKVKWCSIDPNHKNMFVMLDYKLNSVEFSNIKGIKEIDKELDKLESKRSACRKLKAKVIKNDDGVFQRIDITNSSKRYKLLSKAIDKLRNKKREQIKQMLYFIANFLCKNYNYIIIGDYTPDNKVADVKNKRRSMLNQSFIGKFRRILKEVCLKSSVRFEIINEKNTTSDCSHCGNRKYKDPSVRVFTCPICGYTVNRDINSCINIAIKGGIVLNLSGTDYLTLNKVKYNVVVNRRVYIKEIRLLMTHIKTTESGIEVGKFDLNSI